MIFIVVYFALACLCTTSSAKIVAVSFEYEDSIDNAQLASWAYFDDSADLKGTVLIVPDIDGLNQYENERATLLAKSGYIAIGVDIYGKQYTTVTSEQRRAFGTLYRANVTLANSRILHNLRASRAHGLVTEGKVAAFGYCFGGTVLLSFAVSADNPSLQAIVTFHGGLTSRAAHDGVTPIRTALLVHTGSADESSDDLRLLESELEAAGARHWTITRFSALRHAWTAWERADRYDARADTRSWADTLAFLDETFAPRVRRALPPPRDTAGVTRHELRFTDATDGTRVAAWAMYPSAAAARDGASLPIVLIVPDWDGLNEYEEQRGVLLARAGYVAVGVDLYGAANRYVEAFADRARLATLYRSDAALAASRVDGALAALRRSTAAHAAGAHAVIFGYCLGGSVALNYALGGYAANDGTVRGVVAFHGGLSSLVEPEAAIDAKVLVLSGGSDDAATWGDTIDLEKALDGVGATWEMTRWAGIEHGFTSFESRAYNELADWRSWRSALSFAEEVFGERDVSGTPRPLVLASARAVTSSDGVVTLARAHYRRALGQAKALHRDDAERDAFDALLQELKSAKSSLCSSPSSSSSSSTSSSSSNSRCEYYLSRAYDRVRSLKYDVSSSTSSSSSSK